MVLRPDMLLDEADLALIEVDPNVTELEQRLVQEIQYYREEYERISKVLSDARDISKDGKLALDRLKHVDGWAGMPYQADEYCEEAEERFDDILGLDG